MAPTWVLSFPVMKMLFTSLSEDDQGAVGGEKQVRMELGSLRQ